MTKKNSKFKTMIFWLSAIILLFIAVEIFILFIPKMFYGKGYSPEQQRQLTVVAHRGGADLGPENSLECIEKGIRAGSDMIEIDIHLTRDSQIVVCHDQSIDRTTDGSGLIRDLTLDEIRSYNILDSDGNPTSQKIPTFAEVLDLVGDRCRLLVEIKRTNDIYQGIEQKMIDEARAHGALDRIVAQSFNDSVLENLHKIDPSLRLEKLLFAKLPGLPVIVDTGLNSFSFKKYDYVKSFNFYYGMLSRELIDSIHARGKEVKIWTLDGPDTAPFLPVDAVITNSPDLWKSTSSATLQ